jgi:LuxR family maltose regulon positive regulatory protein
MAVDEHNLIILSKLQAPQIATKTLRRMRLIDALQKNLGKKVILLCAGAGYGKTTLLSQFLLRKKIPYLYYHLEKSDAEPAVFLSYLITGLRKLKPGFGKKTERLSRFFNYPKKYLEVIAGTFINEAIEQLQKDIFIILEDYHELTPSDQIDRIIDYMVRHLPPHLHFIITSRTVPLVFSPLMRARDEIFEINSHELKFTKNEIKHLFAKIYEMPLKDQEAQWIEEHSEGWPTSLRLMLQSSDYLEGIKSSDYVRKILDSYHRSQANLFNYFVQEIFSKESKTTQRFLLDCSILEWLTPELCIAVTRRKDSDTILSNLTTRNAFLFNIPGVGYRFHNLFKNFLQSKFINLARKKRIYRRAGTFYIKQKNVEHALRFFLAAEEYKKAASLIEKIGVGLTEQGKNAILCSYIEQLPQEIRNQRPKLLMNYVQSLIYVGRADEAKLHCLRAVKLLNKSRKNRTQYADALYRLGGIYLNEVKYTVAKKWLLRALRACPKNSRLTRASILNSIGSADNEIGGRHLRKAIQYFKEALQIAQCNKYKELVASILNNWAWCELKMGNLYHAYLKYSKMVDILKKYYSFGCGAGFYNASQVSLLLGNKEEARSILDLGIKTCNAHSDIWSMARLWHGYALLYEELGDIEKAKQFISKSLDVYEKLSLVRLIINALNEMSKMYILTGELNLAWRNLSAVWWFKKNRDDAEAIPILLTEAKLQMAQGKYREAEDILSKELQLAQRSKQIYDSFLITVELSKVYYKQGDIKKLTTALREAIAMSKTKGYNYLLLKVLQKEQWMLPMIKKENIEKNYIVSLVKKSHIDIHWVDVCLLGIPKVAIDGHGLAESAWKTSNTKKLFLYLLLQKQENVSQDSIMRTFWPHASHKTGCANLRKTIQYIRETIKSQVVTASDIIVSHKGMYQLASHFSIALDIDEFEHVVKQAKTLKIHDERLREHVQRALSLYKEGFASGWYDEWIEDNRRYYENLYEDCLTMMAQFYFHTKRFKQASVWYKKLLSLNFYNEEYHRQLMMTYAYLKQFQEITQNFEKLKKVLKEQLHTVPQQATVRLYATLVK